MADWFPCLAENINIAKIRIVITIVIHVVGLSIIQRPVNDKNRVTYLRQSWVILNRCFFSFNLMCNMHRHLLAHNQFYKNISQLHIESFHHLIIANVKSSTTFSLLLSLNEAEYNSIYYYSSDHCVDHISKLLMRSQGYYFNSWSFAVTKIIHYMCQ